MVFEFLKKQKSRDFPGKLEVPMPPPFRAALPPLRAAKKEKLELPELEPFPEEFERTAIEEQRGELEKIEHREAVKPIFVNVSIFRNILDELNAARNTLREAQDTVARLSDFREDHDREFKKWQSVLQDMQKKFVYVDKTLFR